MGTTGNLAAQRKKNSKEANLREAEFYFTEGEKYFILEDYAKALVLFEKSSDINPDNATVYYKKAQIHLKADETQKALQDIQKALVLEKNNKYFYVLASDVYTRLGDFNEAADTLEEMIANLDGTDQYLFELAALYLYQKKYDHALNAYNKIEEIYGISEEIVSQKINIHLRLNNAEEALNESKKLIDAFPDQSEFALKYAEILIANERNGEAITFLNKYLLNNKSAEAHLVLSELYLENEKIDMAITNLNAALESEELSPENKVQVVIEFSQQLPPEKQGEVTIEMINRLVELHPDAHTVRALQGDILFQNNQRVEAKNAYLKALELDESNFTVWQNTLQLLFEMNKPDSVIYYSERALEYFPNQGALYYFGGAANLQKENYEEAAFMLESGKKLVVQNKGLYGAFNSMLGDAYNGMEDFKKSDDAYEAALEINENDYGTLNNYAYYLALRKDQLDKAEQMAQRAVKNNPNNSTFLDTYAWVLYANEKYKEAKKVMEQAIAAGNISAVHYEHYGDILYKLGDIDGAVKQWQIAKGMDPDAALIDKKIADRKLYEQ